MKPTTHLVLLRALARLVSPCPPPPLYLPFAVLQVPCVPSRGRLPGRTRALPGGSLRTAPPGSWVPSGRAAGTPPAAAAGTGEPGEAPTRGRPRFSPARVADAELPPPPCPGERSPARCRVCVSPPPAPVSWQVSHFAPPPRDASSHGSGDEGGRTSPVHYEQETAGIFTLLWAPTEEVHATSLYAGVGAKVTSGRPS